MTGYTKLVDFWSLGVLVFEMCCGWSPFYADDTQQMYKNIAFGKVRFPKDTLSLEGKSFVKGVHTWVSLANVASQSQSQASTWSQGRCTGIKNSSIFRGDRLGCSPAKRNPTPFQTSPSIGK